MKFLAQVAQKIYEASANVGYTCDACGVEVFNYPLERLCQDCMDTLHGNCGRICPKCGRKTRAEGVCTSCKKSAPKFTRGFSPFVYTGKTAALVNRMKNGERRLAHFFGEQAAAYFLDTCKSEPPYFSDEKYRYEGQPLLVVPVPATQNSVLVRGYNQAEDVARAMVKTLAELGVASVLDLEVLQKRKDTPAQKHLGFAARAENVSGAYHVHKRAFCKDRVVVLVDDIMTTSATGSECAKLLLSAGARAVMFVSVSSLEELK